MVRALISTDRGVLMRFTRVLLGSLLAASLVAMPMASASAGWHSHHRGGGRGRGLIGALFGVVTAPLVILADAASRDRRDYRDDSSQYDEGPQNYPSRQAENYPPPGYGGQGYDYPPPPPRGYYPQQQYYAPPPPYRGPPQSAYNESPQGYYPPQQQAYSSSDYYGPPQNYAPRQRYYDYPPGY
jgi:hypothetical protein